MHRPLILQNKSNEVKVHLSRSCKQMDSKSVDCLRAPLTSLLLCWVAAGVVFVIIGR